jgi:hypothetical protein
MLGLSLVVLLLDMGMCHSFVPNAETIPFIALVLLSLGRLLWRERKESK